MIDFHLNREQIKETVALLELHVLQLLGKSNKLIFLINILTWI